MAFVAIARLGAKRGLLGLKQAYFIPQGSPSLVGTCHTMVKGDYMHDEKNTKLNRPMSPHLTIYKYQMTMVLSISHRITGIALATYVMGLSGSALLLPHDITFYINAIEAWNLSAPTIAAGKFMIGFPFVFHTCNGVRHLIWDSGRYLNKNAVVTTGMAMLTACALTTAAVIFM